MLVQRNGVRSRAVQRAGRRGCGARGCREGVGGIGECEAHGGREIGEGIGGIASTL